MEQVASETSKENRLQRVEAFLQLPVARQLGFLIGVAAAVALGFAAWQWSREPSYGMLFGNLDQTDTMAVMESLQRQGIPYRLDERTGALMVPSRQVHQLRLSLANEGLPQSAPSGLDLLNQKHEFGTSQFLETARYQHALEGELARSIMTLAAVAQARIHLALPKQSSFIRKKEEPSASVLVTLHPGRRLEREQVEAITHMVASSIPNLLPSRVTVVDQTGNLLSERESNPELAASREQFEHTMQIERAYIDRIEDILAPVVGRDGVRAQVKAEVDYALIEQTQESYNPDLPALRSQQLFEEVSNNNGPEGVPGALTNQPPAAGTAPEVAQGANAAAGTTTPARTTKRSTNNYELDRTISHTRQSTGGVKRLSVAVVIDDRVSYGADGQATRQPRTPEEMDRLTALVREAVGYDASRGDSVNVINAAFNLAPIEALPEPPLWQQTWFIDLVKQVLFGLVLLALILFLVVPTLRIALGKGEVVVGGEEGEAGEGGALMGPDGQLALSGPPTIATLPKPEDGYDENLALARDMARADPKHIAQVLRTWLSEDEEK